MRKNRPLAREIASALLFKVVALAVLFVLFFAPDKRIEVTAESLGQVLIGSNETPAKP